MGRGRQIQEGEQTKLFAYYFGVLIAVEQNKESLLGHLVGLQNLEF